MRQRTLYVRTAVSFDHFQTGTGLQFENLEEMMRHLLRDFTQIRDRSCSHAGKTVEVRHATFQDDQVRMYLVAYTPDDNMSVVPHAGNTDIAELEISPPPINTDYLDGDLMLIIRGDNVIICQSAALRATALPILVDRMARNAGWNSQSVAFNLKKKADIDVIETIRREGVHAVNLNSVAHKLSVDDIEKNASQTLLSPLLTELKALIGFEAGSHHAEAENLKISVDFKFDKKNGTVLDQREIRGVAEFIIDSDEELFTIQTLLGNRFSSEDTVLSQTVNLPKQGKTVQYIAAWQSIEEFFNQLERGD